MKQNKHRRFSARKAANAILIIFAILFFVFYPYHKTLWGGLIFSFASAGLIGGIADWFAIRSFFTKPLGINWPEALFKTEMIPKNREEVISVIVDIVQDKVITKEALTAKIKEIGISELLIDYAVEHRILNSAVEEMIAKINISSVKENQKYFKSLARQAVAANKSEIYEAVDHIADWAINKGYIHDILSSSAEEMQELLKLPEVYDKLSELSTNVKNRYSGDNILNRLFSNIFSSFNDIPGELISKADTYLESAKDPDFIAKYDLAKYIQRFAKYSVVNSLRNFISKADIKVLYDEVAATSLTEGIPANITQAVLYKSIDKLNGALKRNTALREKLVTELNIRLSNFLYEKIEYIIKNKLAEYSNEMLTEEIYNSVGDDLNMIRLNGSLVGGMVGVITFIIMYIAG